MCARGLSYTYTTYESFYYLACTRAVGKEGHVIPWRRMVERLPELWMVGVGEDVLGGAPVLPRKVSKQQKNNIILIFSSHFLKSSLTLFFVVKTLC